MSSCNVHLSPEEREKALSINRSLSKAKQAAQNGHISCRELRDSVNQAIYEAGGKIDYAENVDQEIGSSRRDRLQLYCIGGWIEKVRLIDNLEEVYE